MTRLLWYYSDKFGCGTYRCYVPAYGLEQTKQFTSKLIAHQDVQDPVPYDDLNGQDVVIFQRPIGTLFRDLALEAKKRDMGVIYEMDDLLFKVPGHNPASVLYKRKEVQRILQEILELTDVIIVSTKPLAEMVRSRPGLADKVHICHNHLHEVTWGDNAVPANSPKFNNGEWTIIGWAGSATHETDIKLILPALTRIIKEYPKVMFRFLGNAPVVINGVIPADRFQWTKGVIFQRYPALLNFANLDIGLAPITDSLFNRSKSNIKWLDYSAVGVPCVASNVYPYAKSIRDGETGFLASSVDEWYVKIKKLLDSPELRREMATKAKLEAWRDWSDAIHLQSWIKAIRSTRSGFDEWQTARLLSQTQTESLSPSTS